MKKIILFTLSISIGIVTQAALEINRVIPSKIIYRLNESATVKVTLANNGKSSEQAVMKVYSVSDIFTRKMITEKQIKLVPGEVKTISIKWNTGKERYGRAIRVEIWKKNKLIVKRSEFFNVINEWWRVSVIGTGLSGSTGLSGDKILRQEIFDYYHVPYYPFKHSFYPGDYLDPVCGPFLGYASHATLFASMPSFFGEHTPDIDDETTWYSGRGWYPFTSGKLKKTVSFCKKWGFKISMFSIAAITGPAGFELARQNPKMVSRTKTGSFADSGYASPDPIELSGGITKKCAHWYGVAPDLYDFDVLKFGAYELAKGIKLFDWDGVFFDGCGYIARPGYNWKGRKFPGKLSAQQISARNIKATREILQKTKPDLFIWYNGANPLRADTGGGGHDGTGGGKADKLEMISCPQSGNLKEFQSGQIANPRNAGHNWRSYFEILLSERDALRKHDWGRPVSDITITGGLHPELFAWSMSKSQYAATRSQWAWSNHVTAIIASSQVHMFGGGGGMRPMVQLMTRFSKFFWHEDLKIMTKAYKSFSLDGSREVWWDDAVYILDTPKYTDYIINLINCPDKENAVKNINKDPVSADDVKISCSMWSNTKKLSAWAIQPYGYRAKHKEPAIYKLNPKISEGEVRYELPPFKYYTLMVIRKFK